MFGEAHSDEECVRTPWSLQRLDTSRQKIISLFCQKRLTGVAENLWPNRNEQDVEQQKKRQTGVMQCREISVPPGSSRMKIHD